MPFFSFKTFLFSFFFFIIDCYAYVRGKKKQK